MWDELVPAVWWHEEGHVEVRAVLGGILGLRRKKESTESNPLPLHCKECIAKSGKYGEDGDFAGEIHTLGGGFVEWGVDRTRANEAR
jgi:hypothetical protein